MNKNRIVVVGAGIVGVTSALELQRRGYRVMMIDRKPPGCEASYGNAGVLSDASVIVVNNPQLPFRLPRMLFNRNIGLRYDLRFAVSRLPWITKFLLYSTKSHMRHSGRALRDLQVTSLGLHKRLISEAGADYLLRNTGWLKLYRTQKGFAASRRELDFLREVGVSFATYSTDELRELEPFLKPMFHQGVLMTDTCSVSSPGKLTETYAQLFAQAGGGFRQTELQGLRSQSEGRWQIEVTDGDAIEADHLVIAAGPWSAEICKRIGYSIPMAWERGYHMHLKLNGTAELGRPVYDVEGGFVMAPQQQGIRVLTGVELTHHNAPPNFQQVRAAVAGARQILDLGEELDPEPWLGSRSTLVDSLPMVGAAPRHKGLWFNFGHQHVGLSTSTGCAEILADLMENNKPRADHLPFRPDRFRT